MKPKDTFAPRPLLPACPACPTPVLMVKVELEHEPLLCRCPKCGTYGKLPLMN